MMLVTVRPGPILHVWQNGQAVVTIPLTVQSALVLAADLLRAVSNVRMENK